MKISIIDHGFRTNSALLKKEILRKVNAEFEEDGLRIELSIDKLIGPEESYQITEIEKGYRITGTDVLGLNHGIGKFLHTSKWSEDSFEPMPPSGVVSPACSYRCIYFSVHNYNWYYMAPDEELEDYLEYLALWGYNTIHCIIPVMNVVEEGDASFVEGVTKARKLFTLAKNLGMKTSFGINNNQGFLSAPEEFNNEPSFDLKFRGNAGRNLCPNKPGAMEYLREIWRIQLKQFTDIVVDYIQTWPYDEGGCGCEKCRPWGAKVYCDTAIALREEAIKYYPNVKFVVATWAFDVPEDEGEYAGLYKRLKGDMSWVDMLIIDAHREFPQFALDNEVIKPIVNFPEISMWALYPWGGFGANPLPKRFQAIWDSSKRVLSGGQPYSEGTYEDLLKIQMVGYYWEPDKSYQDILKEYIRYEYAWDVADEVLEMMELIEINHSALGCYGEGEGQLDLSYAYRAKEIARKVDAILPERAKTGWRWRILYIRALLDVRRYEYYEAHKGEEGVNFDTLRKKSGFFFPDDEEVQTLLWELYDGFHMTKYWEMDASKENAYWATHPQVNRNYAVEHKGWRF